MTKAQLQSKHLGELHALAAKAEIPRYRMLSRTELIEKLADDGSQAKGEPRRGGRNGSGARGESRRRQGRRGESRPGQRKPAAQRPSPRKPVEQRPASQEVAEPRATERQPSGEAAAPRPRRRRRRWRRRGRNRIRLPDLLLPAAGGRQAILYGETREGCTAILREVAAELSAASKGPDPVALLVDPSPEELADWKRDAPRVEIVAAGQAHHVDDAIGQAARRADGGEDVIVLVDSLSRFAEIFGDADSAKELFNAGRGSGRSGNGSLTVVAAIERQ
ncbi:MAG: hypothetical protein WBM00_04240 [Solirubrobacterales bacterium]